MVAHEPALDNLQFHQLGALLLNHREGLPASGYFYKFQYQNFHLSMALKRVSQKPDQLTELHFFSGKMKVNIKVVQGHGAVSALTIWDVVDGVVKVAGFKIAVLATV